MNSFMLRAVGTLACEPELVVGAAVTFSNFCPVGYEVGERDLHVLPTAICFLAYDDIAIQIARNASEGDQLILEAKVVARTPRGAPVDQGTGHAFVVTGFRFGARRDPPQTPIASESSPTDPTLFDDAMAAIEISD